MAPFAQTACRVGDASGEERCVPLPRSYDPFSAARAPPRRRRPGAHGRVTRSVLEELPSRIAPLGPDSVAPAQLAHRSHPSISVFVPELPKAGKAKSVDSVSEMRQAFVSGVETIAKTLIFHLLWGLERHLSLEPLSSSLKWAEYLACIRFGDQVRIYTKCTEDFVYQSILLCCVNIIYF